MRWLPLVVSMLLMMSEPSVRAATSHAPALGPLGACSQELGFATSWRTSFTACGGVVAHASGQFNSARRTRPAPGAQPQSAPSPAPGEFRQVLVLAVTRLNACGAPGIRGPGNAAGGLLRSWRPRKVDAQIEKPPLGWLRA